MKLTYDHYEKVQNLFYRIEDHYPDLPEDIEVYLIHDSDYEAYGWQAPGEIGINFAVCKNWKDVVGTLIHEYWHFFQIHEDWTEEECDAVAARDLEKFLEEPK